MKHLYSLPALLLLFVMLFISGCGKNDCTECCESSFALVYVFPQLDTNSIQYPYQQFSGSITKNQYYYYYLPGTPARVQFFQAVTKDDICTGDHLNINLRVKTGLSIPQDRPVKIFGEAYWSVFSDETILIDQLLTPDHEYSGTISNVGLKQAFPEGAAEVDFYLNVEFESLGSLAQDIAYFQQNIYVLDLNCNYKKF